MRWATITPSKDLLLFWEYWNGKRWAVIKDITPSDYKFSSSNKVTFTCPTDIASTVFNDQKSYWIRVRILKGDYGKEIFKTAGKDAKGKGYVQKGELGTRQIKVPKISELTINYVLKLSTL